jgi:hypothetical protein
MGGGDNPGWTRAQSNPHAATAIHAPLKTEPVGPCDAVEKHTGRWGWVSVCVGGKITSRTYAPTRSPEALAKTLIRAASRSHRPD